jgi:hypothetical protein
MKLLPPIDFCAYFDEVSLQVDSSPKVFWDMEIEDDKMGAVCRYSPYLSA